MDINDNRKSGRRHRLSIGFLVLIDILLINFAAYMAVLLRFEFIFADLALLGIFDTLKLCLVPGTLAALVIFKFFNLF